jgi:ferredoxin
MTTINRTKDRQCNDHNKKDEGQTMQWPQWKGRRTDNTTFFLLIVVIALSVLRSIYCGHCIVCSSSFLLWSWYCLSFVLKDRQYNDHNKKDVGQTIPWPQWKGRRTHNTMTTINRTKDRQCNDHNKKDVLRPFYCGHCIVCPSSFLLWSLYCLSFFLFIVVIVLSVLRPFYCGHCIVCPRQCNDHNEKDEGQTMQWPQ